MTDEHDRYAQWAAAYTLGALEAEDRRTFETHLASCSTCSAELAQLAPLAALIAKSDPGDIEHHPDPDGAARLSAAAGAELRALRQRGTRWRRVAAGLAAASVLLLTVLVVDVGGGDPDPPPEQAASLVSSVASRTHVAVSARAWGTEVTLDITGLPARDGYTLWTIDTSGEWTSAATWSPTPTGVVRLTGASRTPTDQIERILVTSDDPDDLLVEASV